MILSEKAMGDFLDYLEQILQASATKLWNNNSFYNLWMMTKSSQYCTGWH